MQISFENSSLTKFDSCVKGIKLVIKHKDKVAIYKSQKDSKCKDNNYACIITNSAETKIWQINKST